MPEDELNTPQDSKSDAFNYTKFGINDGHEIIINVGGDGTLNEVINGIQYSKNPKTPVVSLPIGTGNDIPGGMGLPYHPDTLPDVLKVLDEKNRDHKLVDLGLVSKRYFAGVAGIGFDAQVTYLANSQMKIFKGYWNYIFAIMRALGTYPGQTIKATYDGKTVEQKNYLTAIGVGSRYGAGLHVCPYASVTDGKFDITFAKKMSRAQFMLFFPKAFSGAHVGLKKWVDIDRTALIKVENGEDEKDPVLVQVDGEVIGTLPATFKTVPKALNLVYPKNQE